MEVREDAKVAKAASANLAGKVSLDDFSAALSHGVLRAIEERKRSGIDFRPWIWAGWIIGDGPWGPNGPFDGGNIPGGPRGTGGGF